jgi:hypothetical protein
LAPRHSSEVRWLSARKLAETWIIRKAASRRTLGIGVKAANASFIELELELEPDFEPDFEPELEPEPEPGFVELDATSPDVIILCAVKFWMPKVESSRVLANTRFSHAI